ncbi:MAG: type 1 glutamine amidotransferase [Marmoricola sp.]
MKLLVIQHDHTSPLGPIAERFVERGYDLTMHQVVSEASFLAPGVQTEFPDFTDYDAVVPMGAPWSTYDHELIGSWVLPEIEQLRRADEAGVPVMGICFGGQLLASALGGAVHGSTTPEIGWYDVHSDDEALVPPGPWFQWHYDRWQLPPGAREVARNDAASQAFVLRRNLGVQFHPELTSTMLAGWLAVGGDEEVRAGGFDPDTLVSSTLEREPEARLRAHRLVDGFLDGVATKGGVRAHCGATE